MLALTRKQGEVVVCCLPDGSEVRIRVLEISKNGVRLGLLAPQNVCIWRHEIYEVLSPDDRRKER